jgi:hypothetical protein
LNENTEENFAEDTNSQGATPAQPSSQVVISKDLLMKVGAGVAALVVVLGLVFFVLGNKSDGRLTAAITSCGYADSSGITLAEDGQSLLFDGMGGDDYTGSDFNDIECILTDLEAPSTIYQQMRRTSSLMGVQNANWDGISVSWSYHPDTSIFATFEIEQ